MNKYCAFYRRKMIEVEAETTYKAQVIAAEKFKAKKAYEVAVVLVEKMGEPVVHLPLM